jgi:hypothetical protein
MPRPESVCNGCGKRKPTSKEHLVHVAVARALLKDRAIKTGKDRDAALRAHPFFSGLRLYRDPLRSDPERPIFLTVYVENLICRECNQSWARELEEEAGNALYQFIHLHRSAQAVLREWSFYFAVKLWWAQRRAEALRWGDLVPVLRAISGRVGPPSSIRVAQVRGRRWEFASMAGGWAGDPPHITFIIRGVVFIVRRLPKGTDVPWPSVELEAGVTRSTLPVLQGADLRHLFEIDSPRVGRLSPDVTRP